jgi:hypothetical protein
MTDDIKEKLMNFHPLHAVGFGLLGGYIGSKYGYDFKKTAGFVGVGSWLYMSKVGHVLPWNVEPEYKPVSSGIVLQPDNIDREKQFDNTTSTPMFSPDYYEGFEERLQYTIDKGYTNVKDYVATHSNLSGVSLADGLYRELNLTI